MRTTGFVLLWIGFAAVCWLSLVTYPVARPIIVSHYGHLPKNADAAISLEQATKEIRGSTLDALRYCRVLVVPSFMMLAGGLLLGANGKKKL